MLKGRRRCIYRSVKYGCSLIYIPTVLSLKAWSDYDESRCDIRAALILISRTASLYKLINSREIRILKSSIYFSSRQSSGWKKIIQEWYTSIDYWKVVATELILKRLDFPSLWSTPIYSTTQVSVFKKNLRTNYFYRKNKCEYFEVKKM